VTFIRLQKLPCCLSALMATVASAADAAAFRGVSFALALTLLTAFLPSRAKSRGLGSLSFKDLEGLYPESCLSIDPCLSYVVFLPVLSSLPALEFCLRPSPSSAASPAPR